MEQVPISNAYIWALTVFVAFLFIAILISLIIPYKPNNPCTTARRIWFWILAAATPIVGFLINNYIAGGIEVPSQKAAYLLHSGIGAGVAIVLFVLLGFILSKIFRNSKLGTWF